MKIKIRTPVFLALSCIFVWSFIPLVAKLGQATISNYTFLFWTNLFSSISTGLVILFSKKDRASVRASLFKINPIILGFLGCYFYYLCLYYGYDKGNPTEILVIQYLWPALIPIFSIFLLKEKLDNRTIIAVLLGFLGAVLVFTKGNIDNISFNNLTVLSIVFIGAIAFALFSVLSKKDISQNVQVGIFLAFLWATVFSFFTMIFTDGFQSLSGNTLIILLLNGVFINGLSYLLWVYALSKSEANKIAPLVYMSPILSIIWLAIFFKQPITFLNIIAIILVLISGILVRK